MEALLIKEFHKGRWLFCRFYGRGCKRNICWERSIEIINIKSVPNDKVNAPWMFAFTSSMLILILVLYQHCCINCILAFNFLGFYLAFSRQKNQTAGERSIKKGGKNLKSSLACRVQSSPKYLQMFSFFPVFLLN